MCAVSQFACVTPTSALSSETSVKAGPRFGDSLQTLRLPLKYPRWLLWDLHSQHSQHLCRGLKALSRVNPLRLLGGATAPVFLRFLEGGVGCGCSQWSKECDVPWSYQILQSLDHPLRNLWLSQCFWVFTSKGGSRTDESLGPPSIHFTRTSTISQPFQAPFSNCLGLQKRVQSQRFTTQLRKNPWRQGLGKEMDENLVGGLP